MIAKTKRQVQLLILVPLVLTLVVAASFLWMKREIAGAIRLQQSARDVEKDVLGLNQVISHYLLHAEERPRIQFRLLYDHLAASLARLQPEMDQERQLITHMQWEQETIGALFPLLTGPGGGPPADHRNEETSDQRDRIVGQLLISSEEIWRDSFRLVKMNQDKMVADMDKVLALSLTFVLGSGAVIVLLAGFIGRGIVRTQRDLEREIDERRQAEVALRESEEHLKASLAEKETLLKEIQHRVKNNLQVISSLVDLQTRELPEGGERPALRELAQRVRAMALVHEQLYQSADLARVEFAAYARSLLAYLWRAHGAAASGITLNLNLEPVSLPVHLAVPCGLILNELATNALKHAFPGRTGGEVTVALRAGAAGRVFLVVEDNGTGLPEGWDWRQSPSLGLHLVQMLAGQLHAAVDVSGNGGTTFTMTFGVRNKEGRQGSDQ